MNTEIKFGEIARLRKENVNPIHYPDAKYIGLEHISQGTLELLGHGFGRDVHSQKQKFYKGDVLFGKLRPYFRKVVIAPFDGICSTDIWVVTAEKESDKAFIKYWMASNAFIRSSTHAAEGSRMPRAQWDWVSEFSSPISDPLTRRSIGESLSKFDDAIRSNSKQIDILEKMAMALFRSFFIDFELQQDGQADALELGKASGDEGLGQDNTVIPSRLPQGWRIARVADLCKRVVNGSTPLRSREEYWSHGEHPWFKTGELADGFLLESEEKISQIGVEQSSVKVLPAGSLLMAIYAAPTVGRLGILTTEATFNQACTGMIPNDEFGLPLLYLWLKYRRGWFNSLATGTGQQNISKSIVEDCPIVIPTQEVLGKFNALCVPLFKEMELLTKQNQTLSRLRDLLLPRLMNGDLGIASDGSSRNVS